MGDEKMETLKEQTVLKSLDNTRRTSDRQRLLRKLWVIQRRTDGDRKEVTHRGDRR